jgi:hypothetical protein
MIDIRRLFHTREAAPKLVADSFTQSFEYVKCMIGVEHFSGQKYVTIVSQAKSLPGLRNGS